MAQKTLIYKFKSATAEKTTPRHITIKLFKNKGKEKKETLHTGGQEYK